jgi:hypothetical protein
VRLFIHIMPTPCSKCQPVMAVSNPRHIGTIQRIEFFLSPSNWNEYTFREKNKYIWYHFNILIENRFKDKYNKVRHLKFYYKI